MKDLLKNLREHLSAMIEEIDNYTQADSDTIIIIRKEDFKYLKHERRATYNYKFHVFSYKNEFYFRLYMNEVYKQSLYEKIMKGELDSLILIKLEKEYTYSGFQIQYEIETEENTLLRKAYRPIAENKGGN